MIKPFKFFHNPIAYTTFGNIPIHSGEIYFIMNKEEYASVIRPERIVPKYKIVKRRVSKKSEDVFKPDYDKFFYYKTRESAEFHKDRLIHWDEHVVGGEIFHNNADTTLTFRR